MQIKLTQYSHGAGCGCKIAPNVLHEILKSNFSAPDNTNLLVGNNSKDDAAVYDLGDGQALISTTDFFMPIVDDPFMFGRIASANAISDVYAMGGKPILAIAILGWPINILPAEVAAKVIEGSRSICAEAGIPLAGGHSIDSPEPIFGLAVNGMISVDNIKKNSTAKVGDFLYLTKPIGVGILTTAEKKGILKAEHKTLAANQMMQLNRVGEHLGKIDGVNAMTDVTGFGLLGHLIELCEGSNVSAEIFFDKVPLITQDLYHYLSEQSFPGGTNRNLIAYGNQVHYDKKLDHDIVPMLLADPQTSGGLLVSVSETSVSDFENILAANHLNNFAQPIGRIIESNNNLINVY
jgi:selenide, water dikinase